jgi:hypothetical protein
VIIYSFKYLMDGSIPTLPLWSVPFSWHGITSECISLYLKYSNWHWPGLISV